MEREICLCLLPGALLCPSLLPPPPPPRLLFYLRSDGLAFSSRASLLSCSAALVCDWLGTVCAAAHFSSPA